MSLPNRSWLSTGEVSYCNGFGIVTQQTFHAGASAGTEHLENFAVNSAERLGLLTG